MNNGICHQCILEMICQNSENTPGSTGAFVTPVLHISLTILTGLEGVRFNYILNRAPRLISAVESHDNAFLKEIRAKGTNEDVFKVPVSAFTLEEMKRNVHLSQLDTLRVLGLEMWQPTPNFSGMDSLLTRFRYWEDDLPHEDPFKPE